MGLSTHNREFKAQRELDKAEAELKLAEKNLDRLLAGFRKGSNIGFDVADLINKSKVGNVVLFVENGILKTAIDTANKESAAKQIMGLAADAVQEVVLFLVTKNPYGFAISVGLELFGIDASSWTKKFYDWVVGDDKDDIQITANGYLKVIKADDGTVYARPYNSSYDGGHIIGSVKDDVLFGGDKDDTLKGESGSDLLLGGNGYDIYFTDGKDTIRDDDGKGRVFLSSTNIQLTGGTQIEKGSKIYKGKDGTTYELKGSDLIINDNITIENFSKISNDLDIVLVDADDIVVTIGNNQSTEGGNGKHSMEFKITLNRALKKKMSF